jgi:tetratricopeptide (TPR) repeat protein
MRNLANTYGYLNRHAEALILHEETLAIQKAKLGSDHPDTLISMNSLSLTYGNLGRHIDALKLHEEALAIQTAKFGPDHPDVLRSMNNIAWSLLTAPDLTLWNPARALELSRRAVEGAPKSPQYLGTYGTAQFRSGDWTGAVETLEKTINLSRSDDPFNACEGFILAMAQWHLGEKDQAREWFAKSVQWMANGQQDHPAMNRFRAEAEELLGIENKKE